ncbi:MAG: hypothetical protein ACRELV_11240 [Longimicrobiales bacterium]
MTGHRFRSTYDPPPEQGLWTSDVRAAYGGALAKLVGFAEDRPATDARAVVASEPRPESDTALAGRVQATLTPLLERRVDPSVALAVRELARGYGELTGRHEAPPEPPTRRDRSTSLPRSHRGAPRVRPFRPL